MKEEKTNTKKRTLYYFLLLVSVLLLAAATVLTVYFTTRQGNDIAQNPPVDEKPGDDSDDDEEPDEPTGGETLYVVPVAADCSVEYDSVYTNTVTGFYYRHQGVDFAAEAGAEVYAVADGKVTDISLSEALGNLITVDHGNGLVSVYRFVELLQHTLIICRQIIFSLFISS